MDKKNVIKDALHQDLPHWDREGTWVEIDKQLHPKKNRRRVLFFVLLIGGAISAGLIWTKKGPESMIQDKEKAEDVRIVAKNDHKKPLQSSAQIVNDGIKNIMTKEVTSFDRNDKSSKINKPYFPNNNIKNNPSVIPYETLRNTIHEIVMDKNENNEHDKTIENISLTQTMVDNRDEKTLSIPNNSLNKNEIKNNVENASLIVPINTITCESISSLKPSETIKSPYVEVSPKLKKWSTTISTSYSIVDSDAKYSDLLALNYVKTQNENVSQKEALDISWTVQRQLIKNIYLSTGVRLLQINEFLVADDIRITNGTVENNQAYVINNVSGVEYLSGNREFENRKGFAIKSPNNFQRINVPISLISQWQVLGRTLSVGAGADINVFQKFSGINMGLDGNFIYKDPQKFAPIYKKRWVNSWNLTVQLDVWNSTKFTGFMGVNLNTDWNTSVNSQWNVDQKYTWYGVNMGWRYHW